MLEEYQKNRLNFIKDILPYFGDNFVLKGGTALNLYYGLDRYSEDIDLDCKTNNMNFINKLKHHKDFKNWNISIKKDTDTVFRVMLDYGALSKNGNYPLKIEVSSRNKNKLRTKTLNYNTINGVNVYTIDELIRMKGVAFSGRDKIRDFYDLGYLLKTYPNHFSKENLLNIEDKIFYSGEKELNLLLKDEILKQNLISNNNDIIFTERYTQDILSRIDFILNNTDDKEQTAKNRSNIRKNRQ